MNTKWNRNYRLVWSDSSGGWVVADELSTPKGRKTLSAVGRVAAAILVAGGMMVSMPEDISALSATGSLLTAGKCTGTTTSITAAYTGVCTATGTDSVTISNTGSVAATGNIAVDATATGVSIDNAGTTGGVHILNGSLGTTVINRAGGLIKDTALSGFAAGNAIFGEGAITSIDNSGTISANQSATNTNSVTALGINIFFLGGSLTGALVNQSSGIISASATLNGTKSSASVSARAISLPAINIGASLSNQGTISATATNHASLNSSSSISVTAWGISHSTVSGSLTNDGTITAQADNTANFLMSSVSTNLQARGISGSGNNIGATITNNGSITATATNTGSNASGLSVGIRATGVFESGVNGTFINSSTGTITASAINNGSSPGETLSAAGLIMFSVGGQVINDGFISGSANNAGTNTTGLGVFGASFRFSANGKLTNRGTISANTTNVTNVNLSVRGLEIFPATGVIIDNSGTIKASSNIAGPKLYAVRAYNNGGTAPETFNNLSGGILQGNVISSDASLTFNNAGLIDLPDDGVVSSVAGAFNQQDGGVLRIGASSIVSYATLSSTGAVTLNGTTVIDVNVSPTNTLAVGNVLTGVIQGGTLTQALGSVLKVTDNSTNFDFTASTNAAGTGIDLTVIAATGADRDLPTITRTGPAVVNVAQNTTYTDKGATAADPTDGDITANITTTGAVNTATLGSYTITYNVSDAAGNAAATVTRTVNVIVDTKPPVITINGANPISVVQNTTFTDPGVTAIDNVDGDISANVQTGGTFVNTSTPGNYTITYDVSDASGNAATQVSRTVTVTAAPATGGGSTGGSTTTDPYSGNSGGLPSCTSPAQTTAQGFGLMAMLLTMLSGLGLVRRRKDK